jgi:serine/threonine-protein kinase
MSEAQRYHVIERIAAGGMAEVYRGESAGIEGFRKKVAIKRVLPKLSANEEFINMFLDEARLGAYLSHSRCVQVFDIGQGAGSHFIVMEYVDGADLKDVLEHLAARNQPMRVEVAVRIALDICEGLAYAHQACDHAGRPLEIVHRDISPHNVLMTRHGEVKLVDFGLAKASSHLTDEDEDIVKGKFGYLAPEVTLGQKADKRVDIFAAGILLWEMLTGRRLFLGETDVDTFKLVRAAQIQDPRHYRADIAEDVVRVLAKALAREPAQRYQTADEMARDLSTVLLRLGRPATYFDIGELVRDAAAERDRRKKAAPNTSGVVGDLIIDALHDFSGAPASQAAAPKAAAPAKDGGFVDPSAWGLDSMFDEPIVQPPAPAAPPPQAAPRAAPAHAPPQQQPAPQAPQAPPPPPRARMAEPPQKKDGPFWRRWFGS